MERKTPLYDRHTAAGGKLVPFAGWLLPVQYSGVIAEHRAVRTGCGLFDVSHMGELLLRGPDALANLNRLMTNDFSGMADGQARYSPMCYEDGGVVDDLIVYRCSDTAWLAVVNASNIGKDRDWMTAHLAGDCTLEDLSDQTAQLALQGPGAEALLRTLTADLPAKNYTAVLHGTVDGRPCLVSRTGYTGEDGFELYCAPADAPALWDALTAAGASPAAWGPGIPCGWRPPCPSTATSSLPPSTPTRRGWASSSSLRSPTSSARPPWSGPAPCPAAGWVSR